MNSNNLFPLFNSFLTSPMKDTTIIELFFNRDENAIRETDKKYGKYCFSIANRILFNRSDSDECVNDTYFKAWTTIPPTLPENLKIYLGKITRNIALNLYEKLHASKRADSQMPVILDEISEMIGENKVEQEINAFLLTDSINTFLKELPKDKRKIFVLRYFHMYSIKEIAKQLNLSESNVKMSLSRTREALATYLRKEGFTL